MPVPLPTGPGAPGGVGPDAFAVDATKAVRVQKAEKWEGAEVGTDIDQTPVVQHTTEIVAEVEDMSEAVKRAHEQHEQKTRERRRQEKEALEAEEALYKETTGKREKIRGVKAKALFKSKVRMVILQNAAAAQFKDNLKGTIKQDRVADLINTGDTTDEALAIERLLARKQRLKQKAGDFQETEEVDTAAYDVSAAHRHVQQQQEQPHPEADEAAEATPAAAPAPAAEGAAAEGQGEEDEWL